MAVPLLDMSRQYAYLKNDMDKAVLNVLGHGKFILGPEVTRLEEAMAQVCGVPYGIGVASGTDALLIALRACGVGPGDEVITSNFSFFASAGVVSRLGARPVFVDIDPESYNIDLKLIEKAITPKTKVIMPVHLFGQLADMDPILEIARKHGLKVIEDAAQAVGAEYKGRPACSMGDFGCLSFYPTKNLGAGGDAGMILCRTEEDYKNCRSLRAHGENPKYFHRTVGYNSRLDSIQAAILLVKLPYLRKWSEQRLAHARIYNRELAGTKHLRLPVIKEYSTLHIFNQYTLASPRRKEIEAALQKAGIGIMIYYPLPFHKQDCFADLGYKPGDFPLSSQAADEVFSIPIYPELTADEQTEVITVLKRILT
jgi:dTDP-4-amino-4,6-dideoxygalactose transaminase